MQAVHTRPIIVAVAILLPLANTRAESTPDALQVSRETVVTRDDGTKIDQFTLVNKQGMRVTMLNYGATLTGVHVADRRGGRENITLHFDNPARYLQGHPLFGSVVGRYANRIADAQFEIDGKTLQLAQNAGKNHIHGGGEGFQWLVWDARCLRREHAVGVELQHTSPAGHEGYPGRLDVTVRYLLDNDNRLTLEYRAVTDAPTHVNLTNHAYWNLGGVDSGNVLDHVIMINANQYLEATPERFPTGKILSVAGTPFDFREPHAIGSRIEELASRNYDDCYVVNRSDQQKRELVARVRDPQSGRMMEVRSTAPGVQFYTAKALNGRLGVGDVKYGPYHGFCLETQHFPDSPNHPHFPSTLLRPGETYEEVTSFRFGVER